MPNARVMVVDDSAAMRALFCDILDNAKGVAVCGVASNADEAREKMVDLKPDVLTLDVEMPGMSGMEFLTEVMNERPMPVIMLSSITQEGTGTAQRALELGAVHCFPKPLSASGKEFDATVAKLGGIVLKAASGELKPGGASNDDDDAAETARAYEPDGSVIVLAAGAAGIEPAKQILAAYPAQCPPTLLLIDAPNDALESALAALKSSVACEVGKAIDGLPLEPGRAYLAFDRTRHVVVEPGSPPRIRQVERDPVAGSRPSADLLLGSLARAKVPAIGGMLAGTGTDGAKGLQFLANAGGKVFLQRPADYEPHQRFDTAVALGIKADQLDKETIAPWILETTTQD